MANPLEVGGPPPVAPQQQGSALMQGAQAQPAQGQMQGPSHAQTVGVLNHLDETGKELRTLLSQPNLGKTSIKSQIIDGITNLVSKRLVTPSQAVITLSKVPDDPVEQRQWLMQQMAQNQQAEMAILDQHRATNPGTGDMATELGHPQYDPEQHLSTMDGLMAQYKGPQNG